MKKSFLILAMGLTPAVTLLSNSYAQHSSVRTLLVKDARILLSVPLGDTTATGATAISMAGISAAGDKAVKNFNRSFKDATEVSWYKIADGFSAMFTQDGNTNRAYFDQKGNQAFTITYYSGKKLPRDVRSMVKGTYYDSDITLVEEIHTASKLIYIVHLEDEKSWKKVKVQDGEMEVLEDFNKN